MSSKPMLVFLVRLVFAVAVVCCIAGVGRAQTYKGEFKLPFEVQWGNTTLPAGDYSFQLERPDSLAPVPAGTIRVTAASDNTLQLAQLVIGRRQDQLSQRSSLILLRNGGKHIVQEIHLKGFDLTFHCVLPKGVAHLMAKGPVLIQRLPILAAAE